MVTAQSNNLDFLFFFNIVCTKRIDIISALYFLSSSSIEESEKSPWDKRKNFTRNQNYKVPIIVI